MAICEACAVDMLIATTCQSDRIGVSKYKRSIGGWRGRLKGLRLPPRCRDCDVSEGGIHHPGCCVAECLRCGGQRLDCPCDEWMW